MHAGYEVIHTDHEVMPNTEQLKMFQYHDTTWTDLENTRADLTLPPNPFKIFF